MVQDLFIAISKVSVLFITMLEIIALCVFFFWLYRASSQWWMELLLAPCQSKSVFSFHFYCSVAGFLLHGWFECDLWLWPLIPALLMMVVNWWGAKGQAYLHCCDVICDVSPFLMKHVEAWKMKEARRGSGRYKRRYPRYRGSNIYL